MALTFFWLAAEQQQAVLRAAGAVVLCVQVSCHPAAAAPYRLHEQLASELACCAVLCWGQSWVLHLTCIRLCMCEAPHRSQGQGMCAPTLKQAYTC